ncbi:MAG: hypothetical protein IIB22_11435 [Chloroflexi bacterium]|nr:hypothetical protein [Chloroflexota bacterium]
MTAMARSFHLFLLVATLAFLSAACDTSSGPSVLFTIDGKPVTEEELRAEFIDAFVVPGVGQLCSAAWLEDEAATFDLTAELFDEDPGALDADAADYDRLHDVLLALCRRLEA